MASKVQVTEKSIQDKAVKSLQKILPHINKLASNVDKKARSIIESATVSNLRAHGKFIENLSDIDQANFIQFLDKYDEAVIEKGEKEKRNNTYTTETVRELWNRFKDEYNPVGASPSSQSHEDFTVIGSRAMAVYFELENLAQGNAQSKDVTQGDMQKADTYELGKGMAASLDQYAEAFRRLGMAATAISRIPANQLKGVTSLEDLAIAAKWFIKNTTQAQWLVIKDKHVDVMAGKATQRLSIKRKQSKAKGDAEYQVATLMAKLWNLESYNLSIVNKALGMQDMDWAKLTGSKSIKSQIEKQLTDNLVKKKSTGYKANTRKQQRAKGSSKLKGQQELEKLITQVGSLKVIKVGMARRAIEGGAQSETADVLKLKKLINKRLGAEIRRNMGRPALLNRTGRFSNSAEVTKLKRTKGGIRGEFTYMLNPYQTFENTGSRKWPTGYNPKPLITKSIRQLARQYTETKFTKLRRV